MRLIHFFLSLSLLPSKKKILLFDIHTREVMENINKNYNILYIRGEKYYLWPLVKTIFKFNFSSIGYYKEVISSLNPNLIITTIDNEIAFYNLKKFFKKKKFIAIQNGHRAKYRSFFIDKMNKDDNQVFKVDYCFLFNKNISEFYKKFIRSKNFIIGSFKSNNIPIVRKIKKRIVFISQYRNETPYYERRIKNIKDNKDFWTEFELLPLLSEFCKKNNIKFYILGCSKTNKFAEKKFYDHIVFKNNFKFIYNDNKQSSYKLLDNSELNVFIDSTLGYESIGRLNKTISISSRKIEKDKKEIFLWPKKNNLIETPINCYNFKNKKKLFEFIKKNYNKKREKWVYENLFYIRNSMNYVKCNLKLKEIINRNIL